MNLKADFRLIALALCVLAIALRLVPHDYNVSAIGAMGMLVGCFWSARIGFLLSLAAMFASDVLGELFGIPSMGFYTPWLMLTVYIAIACSAFIGRYLVGFRTSQGGFAIPLGAGVPLGALASTLVFFLVTNFASWLDPQMMYSRNLAGLADCYWRALPFVKNTLLGNLVYSTIFFGAYVALFSPSVSKVDAR